MIGMLQAAEHSSGALVPIRDSSCSHCPRGGSVTRRTEARVRVSPQSVGVEHPGRSLLTIPPQRLRTGTPLAYNNPVPCSTQRAHATGLWAARNTAVLEDGSAKFGISCRGATCAVRIPAHLTVSVEHASVRYGLCA
jgi:hypothetical protein